MGMGEVLGACIKFLLIVGVIVGSFVMLGVSACSYTAGQKSVSYMAKMLLFALLAFTATDAQACRRCHVATCYGCNYSSGYSSGYAASGYDAPYVLHEDGTWWLDGVEYKRGKKYCSTSATGWCWAWYPVKGQAAAQVPVPFAAQGSTVYGYSQTSSYGQPTLSNLTAAYSTDPALFMNQAYRLQQSAQDNAAKGYTTFASLAADLTGQNQDNARIEATGRAFAAALQAASPSQVSRTFSAQQTVGGTQANGPTQAAQVSTQTLAVLSPALTQSAQARCAGCHTGEANRTQFDLNNLATLSAEGFDKILARIDSPDGEQRMPRRADGPADPLPLAEKAAWFAHRAKLTQ